MHIFIESSCKFDIGNNAWLGMANIDNDPGSMLRVGYKTDSTGLVYLKPVEARAIEIGMDCSIASGVWMTTSNFHLIISWSSGTRPNPAKPVRVGNPIWIANYATPFKRSTNRR